MQDRAQQRIVDLDVSIVIDETKLAKLVHEITHTGSGGADHFRQRFLTDIRGDRLRAAFLAEIREQQQQAGKPPLARIEQLVDQILLDPAVAVQEICHEHFGKFRLVMKGGQHRVFGNGGDHAVFHRRRCRDA